VSSGLRPERSELAGAAKGGAGQFAESEDLEPRREQAQRDKETNGGITHGHTPEIHRREQP
jgi:hypothetical protein